MSSAITTPSRWALKSKDLAVITTADIFALVRAGFKKGVTSVVNKETHVELNLTYCATKDRIKFRFGTAPVACLRLDQDQTIEELEHLETLREKFQIQRPEVNNEPAVTPKRKRAAKKATAAPKAKQPRIAVEECSSEEQDSDTNYFVN